MKLINTSIFVIAFSILLQAQNNANTTRIINTAFANNGVLFLNEKSNQMQVMDYDIPFIEKIEVRSETNDFDLRKHDLTIRVSPNTKSSRKSHRQYHESVQHMTKMEHETQIMNVLKSRYVLIVDQIYTNEMLRIEKSRYTIALDKVKILKKMVSLSSFDIVELIEAEDNIYKLQRTLKNLESKLNDHNTLIASFVNEEVRLKKEDILSVQHIQTIIELSLETKGTSHPEIEVLSAKHYNAMMEHEWESSKTKFSLGFIQAKYGYDPDKFFRNNFSLGFGFNFPIKGSSRLDINELKIKILDSQREYLTGKENLVQLENRSFSRLTRLIDMHHLLKTQIKEGNAEHALTEYSKQKMASPLAILKLKELNVNNESLLIEVEAEIMSTYLEYIYSTGDIGKQPYRNFLDPNLSLL